MILLGGRSHEEVKEASIQVYDTETSEWANFNNFNKFRHSSWILGSLLYCHGGFDHMSPLVSRNDLIEIDVIKLLSTNEKFKKKVYFLVSKK